MHAQETEWQSGVQLCIMPKLPTYTVQELNVGTVHVRGSEEGNLLGGGRGVL